MKEQIRNKRFNSKNVDLLNKCVSILKEYEDKGIKVTLRQLYYQLVARGYIPNLDKSYKKISKLLTDARYCGIVDWDAIEDRIRTPYRHSEFDNILDLVKAAKYNYRLDRWNEQEYYVELFTEKDALSSVLKPIADNWHIYLNVNRGYSSATAIYDAGQRFLEQQMKGKECISLYLGDHDPSGLDMIRDITDRLIEFGCEIKVIPIALTMEQIRKYNPPPNFTKLSDSKSKNYIKMYGLESWEVDALSHDVMVNLVNSTIKQYVDAGKMDKVIKQEKEDIKQLEEFAEDL